jgi:glycosyltransferase involved in cell wall biosynthesis
MTARLSEIKDHATLLRAFAMVVKQYPNVRLKLAGDGELRKPLESLAEELAIVDKVTFLGDIANIYSVMSHWDLFAYATTENEGLGNAVSEAMALGLPCIVTDVGPMREFNGDGEAIRLVRATDPSSMADSIMSVMVDLNIRMQLSSSGHSLSRSRFSSETFSKKYAATLSSSSLETQK